MRRARREKCGGGHDRNATFRHGVPPARPGSNSESGFACGRGGEEKFSVPLRVFRVSAWGKILLSLSRDPALVGVRTTGKSRAARARKKCVRAHKKPNPRINRSENRHDHTTRSSAAEILLPCPFCGGTAVADGGQLLPRAFYNFGVHCGLCETNLGKNYESREFANAAWNRRAR